jgi:(S)-2-hydroxyglutarate dehydrogenase
MPAVDFCVVGGGIVGVATARAILTARPGASLVLIEKESSLGRHQTGHNSGVIHSGIYYPPGSLKATLCRRGAELTEQLAREKGIAWERPGKLIVATSQRELALMADLLARSRRHGLDVRRIGPHELRELEPAVTGLGALHVPSTGIVDYGAITRALAHEVVAAGGQIATGRAVTGLRETSGSIDVDTEGGSWRAGRLVACAGLQADRVAALAGVRTDVRIVPFRGEYFQLPLHRSTLVGRLIYPVPDPGLPFLGVHLTPGVGGRLTVGPNAVLGLSREGYRKLSFSAADARDLATFPGLWRMARSHVRVGAQEMWRSASKRSYLKAARRYCPSLMLEDLLPQEAGIRAQAVARDGSLVHDFHFEQTERSVHVLNAPSPAATSAMPIGELIAQRLLR